jgi:hypothetical protein
MTLLVFAQSEPQAKEAKLNKGTIKRMLTNKDLINVSLP